MFDELSRKLESALKSLRGQGRITPENIASTLREVRRVLLDADVNYHVAREFVDAVAAKATGVEVLRSITPGQQIVKILYDELVRLLGSKNTDVKFAASPPTVILITGLQGSGKTTFCAKLALHLQGRGQHPLLVAADIYRPAAVDQLMILAKGIDVPVFQEDRTDAVGIAAHGVEHARRNARDVVIVDTAGRLHVDEEMMQEVEAVKASVHPHEILFVLDAMVGQDAVIAARAFHERLKFDGAVMTKMDGDARGGAALSVRATVGSPIKFICAGEKPDALERFHPERIASRILGMGDVVTLVEKAQAQIDGEKAERLEQRFRTVQYTLEDFLDQLQDIRKMGPLQQLVGMLPGGHRLPDDAAVDEGALGRIEAIIRSMTPDERRRPQMINGSRRKRIAAGSGTSVQEVNRMLRQYEQMHRMIRTLGKGGPGARALRGRRLPAGL
jgi:signal recognition particle subunit SRP54